MRLTSIYRQVHTNTCEDIYIWLAGLGYLNLNLHNYSFRSSDTWCALTWLFCELLYLLYDCRLRQFTGLDQFVDVVVGGEHSWILEILKFCAFNERLLAVDAILTVLGGPHVLEESQDVRIIRSGLAKLIQLAEIDGKFGINHKVLRGNLHATTNMLHTLRLSKILTDSAALTQDCCRGHTWRGSHTSGKWASRDSSHSPSWASVGQIPSRGVTEADCRRGRSWTAAARSWAPYGNSGTCSCSPATGASWPCQVLPCQLLTTHPRSSANS